MLQCYVIYKNYKKLQYLRTRKCQVPYLHDLINILQFSKLWHKSIWFQNFISKNYFLLVVKNYLFHFKLFYKLLCMWHLSVSKFISRNLILFTNKISRKIAHFDDTTSILRLIAASIFLISYVLRKNGRMIAFNDVISRTPRKCVTMNMKTADEPKMMDERLLAWDRPWIMQTLQASWLRCGWMSRRETERLETLLMRNEMSVKSFRRQITKCAIIQKRLCKY